MLIELYTSYSSLSSRGIVDMENSREEIHFGITQQATPGYKITPFQFISPRLAPDMNGAVLNIDYHKATPPVLITGDTTYICRVIEGNGFFVAILPDKNLYIRSVKYAKPGTDDLTNELFKDSSIIYRKGAIVTWIAADIGLSILRVNQPTFHPSMEVTISDGAPDTHGVTIPEHFWDFYHKCTAP